MCLDMASSCFQFYPDDAIFAVATCLDVTRRYYFCRYCVYTAKPILELFPPSGSSIILVF